MIKIKDLDYDLSLKIGDPRLDNGDGIVWLQVDRLRYLGRAYGKLCRQLVALMGTKAPSWAKKIKSKTLVLGPERTPADENTDDEVANIAMVQASVSPRVTYSDGRNIDLEEGFQSIDQLYVTTSQSNKKHKAKSVGQDLYLDITIGEKNSVYDLDYDKNRFAYTIMNNKLQILPFKSEGYLYATIVFTGEPETFVPESLVDITTDYVDLLITLAAKEAMQDLARDDKVSLYRQEVLGELEILGIPIKKAEVNAGVTT